MDLPIPTHLQPFLTPVGGKNSEFEVTGKIVCPCGCEKFQVFESNGCHIVKLICGQCGEEILILDSGKHGWDGFVCKDDFLDRTLPFQKYGCPRCKEDIFGVTVRISSQGKEDFQEECLSNDDSFSEENWVDAFEWITISLSCEKCSFKDADWVDLETM